MCDNKLRQCIADERKGLFHQWVKVSRIVQPSPMVGGHGGGVIEGVLGIIEFEDGTVEEIPPTLIRFIKETEGE